MSKTQGKKSEIKKWVDVNLIFIFACVVTFQSTLLALLFLHFFPLYKSIFILELNCKDSVSLMIIYWLYLYMYKFTFSLHVNKIFNEHIVHVIQQSLRWLNGTSKICNIPSPLSKFYPLIVELKSKCQHCDWSISQLLREHRGSILKVAISMKSDCYSLYSWELLSIYHELC